MANKPLPAKGANQIATRPPRHCSGPACSQRDSWYRPTAYGPTERPIAWARNSRSL